MANQTKGQDARQPWNILCPLQLTQCLVEHRIGYLQYLFKINTTLYSCTKVDCKLYCLENSELRDQKNGTEKYTVG